MTPLTRGQLLKIRSGREPVIIGLLTEVRVQTPRDHDASATAPATPGGETLPTPAETS